VVSYVRFARPSTNSGMTFIAPDLCVRQNDDVQALKLDTASGALT
jgi:hypothetical protein